MTERNLEKVALKVLEGGRVDWDAEAGGQDDPVIRNLRLLETISRTLRAQETEAVPRTWGNLEIRGLLGSGASSDVYRAWDPALERDVAIKLFRSRDPELQQRMLEEGRRLARVDHPNVVRVYGAEQHDGRVGLWMELVEGRTLEAVMRDGLLGGNEVAGIGRMLCGALAAVHKAGLLHGDIKAQNVIRREDGRLVLTDFGSGVEQEARDASRPTSGTPLYLAPEVLAGASASPASDIYSIGVLLFHLASGDFPVRADSIPDLEAAHAEGARQSLLDLRPDLDPDLVGAIDGALLQAPADRFASMGELDRALSGIPESPSKGQPRLWWIALAVVAASVTWLGFQFFAQPAAGPGYQLESRLFRVEGPGAFSNLADGGAVSVGDQLVLELTADMDLHAYVFNEDRHGRAFGLFPLASLGQSSRLAHGASHRLPGLGADLAWVVDSEGGIERIHIVTSPTPLPNLEDRFSRLPPASLEGTVFSPRGIGSVGAVDDANPMTAAALIQAIGGSDGEPAMVEGVHHDVFELHHQQR